MHWFNVTILPLRCLLNRHLAHRLTGDDDATRRLIATRRHPPRLPVRSLCIGVALCDSRCDVPHCYTEQGQTNPIRIKGFSSLDDQRNLSGPRRNAAILKDLCP